jgi:hypothetical protein
VSYPGAPMTAEQKERQRRKVQEQLDDALAASFPASDPVSIVTSQEEEDWGQPDPAAPDTDMPATGDSSKRTP